MSAAFRRVVLVTAATALLSAQAAIAAPPKVAAPVDPLVSLSVLGTPQSRAAVCATGSCAVPSATLTASAATAQGYDQTRQRPNLLPFLLVLGAAIILMAIILSDGDDSSGDLTPVSP